MDCRCWVERPGDKTPETHRRGIVCAKLSAGLTLIREPPIAPTQHILFFVICTWEWPHSISTNFSTQCAWLGAKNDNYITFKCYLHRYQMDKNNKPLWFQKCENQAHCALKLVLEWDNSRVRMTKNPFYYAETASNSALNRWCVVVFVRLWTNVVRISNRAFSCSNVHAHGEKFSRTVALAVGKPLLFGLVWRLL